MFTKDLYLKESKQKQEDQIIKPFIFKHFDKQIASCESTGKELSSEWSHHRISSTDSKVRVTLQNSIKNSGSERTGFTSPIAKSTGPVPSDMTFFACCKDFWDRVKNNWPIADWHIPSNDP